MKKLTTMLLIATMAMSLVACGGKKAEVDEKEKSAKDSIEYSVFAFEGVDFSFPKDWELTEDESGFTLKPDDDCMITTFAGASNTTTALDLNLLTLQAAISAQEGMSNFKSEDITLSKQPAKKATGDWSLGEKSLKVVSYVYPIGDKACYTMFAATEDNYTKYKEDFVEMMEKIKLPNHSFESADANASAEDSKTYHLGETWEVPGQWKFTINSIAETDDRNKYSDKAPNAVYIIDYTYENIGYDKASSDGLFMNFLSAQFVDESGAMGYSYPADVSARAQRVPVGASCNAQYALGVDAPGAIKVTLNEHDANGNKVSATYELANQ
ncbi:hypothetical protein M2149_000827 [Lachnospiraceae bacterium PFB1-21]